MAARLPAVVIDCGTGYTKMGYAGNSAPNYIGAPAPPLTSSPPCHVPRFDCANSTAPVAWRCGASGARTRHAHATNVHQP